MDTLTNRLVTFLGQVLALYTKAPGCKYKHANTNKLVTFLGQNSGKSQLHRCMHSQTGWSHFENPKKYTCAFDLGNDSMHSQESDFWIVEYTHDLSWVPGYSRANLACSSCSPKNTERFCRGTNSSATSKRWHRDTRTSSKRVLALERVQGETARVWPSLLSRETKEYKNSHCCCSRCSLVQYSPRCSR